MSGVPDDDREALDDFLVRVCPPPRTAGPLREVIKASKRATGLGMADLTVLANQNDPYRQDTPANHRCAHWFAEQVQRFVPGARTIHLRGLHYRISQTEIDAAIALEPAALDEIVRNAVKPFYDPSLERRARAGVVRMG